MQELELDITSGESLLRTDRSQIIKTEQMYEARQGEVYTHAAVKLMEISLRSHWLTELPCLFPSLHIATLSFHPSLMILPQSLISLS